MTTEQLAEIEGRANAATEGPWGPYEDDGECIVIANRTGTHRVVAGFTFVACYASGPVIHGMETPDAAFIANARADIPALLAHVRRLERALEQATKKLGLMYDDDDSVQSLLKGWPSADTPDLAKWLKEREEGTENAKA